jgi:hypothetical protein
MIITPIKNCHLLTHHVQTPKILGARTVGQHRTVLLLHLSPLKIWRIPSHQNLWEVDEVTVVPQ